MKITINKGTDLNTALQKIEAFLRANTAGYDIISSCALYINLENDKQKPCPLNRKEFSEMEAGSLADMDGYIAKILRKKLLKSWTGYVEAQSAKISDLVAKIMEDEDYLQRAAKKGYAPHNISNRQAQVSGRKAELKEEKARYDLLKKLDRILDENDGFQIRVGKASYTGVFDEDKITVTSRIIFEDSDDGSVWVFERKQVQDVVTCSLMYQGS